MDRGRVRRDGSRYDVGPTLVTALIVAGLAAVVMVTWFGRAGDTSRSTYDGRLISAIYDPPRRPIERVYNARDGQVFATQAVDPLASHPEMVRFGPEEQAYRYQRAAYGWLGWVASGGQAHAVPWALVALTATAAVGLVAAVAEVLRRAGRHPFLALVLLATPGVAADLLFVGPEILGGLLVVLGLAAWLRDRPSVAWAVAAFGGAGLCRETLLLVPATLVVLELLGGRRRRAAAMAVAAFPYAAWVGFIRLRTGALPVGTTDGRLSPVPLVGLADAVSGWSATTGLMLVGVFALGIAGAVRTSVPTLRALIVAHLVLAVFLGPAVWARAADVGRVFVPLGVVGLLALAGAWNTSVRPATTSHLDERTYPTQGVPAG